MKVKRTLVPYICHKKCDLTAINSKVSKIKCFNSVWLWKVQNCNSVMNKSNTFFIGLRPASNKPITNRPYVNRWHPSNALLTYETNSLSTNLKEFIWRPIYHHPLTITSSAWAAFVPNTERSIHNRIAFGAANSIIPKRDPKNESIKAQALVSGKRNADWRVLSTWTAAPPKKSFVPKPRIW